MNMDKNIQEIPMEDIIPNRFQPRLAFNEEGITELAESIKQHGIIQPLVVRRLGDKFEIIAGERRYKAATMAGLTKVPVIISDIDDNKSAEVALVENIQRRNLTAIEEAKSYKNLLDRGYLTQEQLANKMGVSQSSIANKLRLLNLDEEVQDALLNEKISERHARALLALEDKEEQKKWLQRIINERLTVRQLDMELKKREEDGGEEEAIPLVEINPNIDEIVNNAEDINVIREPHDVASMLLPEGVTKVEEPVKEEPTPTKMPNKFFNFLEDEQANMNVLEPDEILNTFTAQVAPITNVEPVAPTTTEPVNAEPKEEVIETPVSIEEVSSQVEEPTQVAVEPTIEQPILEEAINPFAGTQEIVEEKVEEAPTINNVELLDELDEAGTEGDPKELFSPFGPTLSPFAKVEEQILQNEQVEPEVVNNVESAEEPTISPIIEEPIATPSTPVQNETINEVPSQNMPSTEPVGIEPIMMETPSVIASEENKMEEPTVTPILSSDENQIQEPIIEENNEIMANENIEPTIEPVINNEELTPFKSIFFNTGDEEEQEPVVEQTPVVNNTIEEVKPIIEEPLVDPLDSIVKLEPDYEAKQQELAGTDLKTAINVVRDTVSDLERRGFLVEIEEADLEDLYHITIKINKNN